jgi:hypothetical protein
MRIGKIRLLFRKTEGERPLGGLRRRWEDNTEMDLKGNMVWQCEQNLSGICGVLL